MPANPPPLSELLLALRKDDPDRMNIWLDSPHKPTPPAPPMFVTARDNATAHTTTINPISSQRYAMMLNGGILS